MPRAAIKPLLRCAAEAVVKVRGQGLGLESLVVLELDSMNITQSLYCAEYHKQCKRGVEGPYSLIKALYTPFAIWDS